MQYILGLIRTFVLIFTSEDNFYVNTHSKAKFIKSNYYILGLTRKTVLRLINYDEKY